ncbi:MAG: alpha/beta hydrolase [Gemmatimonadales bacterium]
MRRFGRGLLLWSAVVTHAAAAQDRILADTILAPSLGHRAVYRVVLPEGYDSGFRYPVLWLLHGYGGDETDWLRQTDLVHQLRRYPILVVLPSVKNSFYVNSRADPASRYEDFVMRDLHDDVVRRYAVDTLREGIAGLSMGGYGALMLALRHPRRYRFAGVLSGALLVPSPLEREDTLAVGLLPAIDSAFGPEPNPHRRAHDPFVLFRRTPAPELPYLYFLIGSGDPFPTFLPRNRALTDSLRVYGARYEYHEVPGGHDWGVWGGALPSLLARFWVEVTAPQRRPPP